jgi:hypothetical protein
VPQRLEGPFHAGQAGIEGDLDHLPPDLFAAVLVVGQVEGGILEQHLDDISVQWFA